MHRQESKWRRLPLVTRIAADPYSSKNRKGRQEYLNLISLMIPSCNFCLCSVLKICHLTTSGGNLKPRFCGQGEIWENHFVLGWSHCHRAASRNSCVCLPWWGERSCPSQKGTWAQALLSCAAHSPAVALRLLPKPRSRAPSQDEWFFTEICYQPTHCMQ